uniref:Uncharacterized protein n=1 Tax=Globisporangium ultimum (strain ATCC 200006 / CBS 805.95 / DAOM BR144) TaxID=431595 RepID=K3XCV0_GLOUD
YYKLFKKLEKIVLYVIKLLNIFVPSSNIKVIYLFRKKAERFAISSLAQMFGEYANMRFFLV